MRVKELVVRISKYLPIWPTRVLPGVVVGVVVEVDIAEAASDMSLVEISIPGDLRCGVALQVYPYKAPRVDVSMNWEKAVGALVKSGKFLVPWCFGKLPIQSVGPAMILAAEDSHRTLFFLDNGECSVSASVVEAVDIVVSVLGHDEIEPGNFISDEVAWFRHS
jgi:hypothetical protein